MQPLLIHCLALSPSPTDAVSQVEVHVTSIHCISRAEVLPFEVSDAARSEEEIKQAEEAGELRARVSQDVRLNGRYIDLRTPANQAIFKIQSGVCQVSWFYTKMTSLT